MPPKSPIHVHDLSLSCLDTSIKGGGLKLVLWTHIYTLNQMIKSCKFFTHFFLVKFQPSHITMSTTFLMFVAIIITFINSQFGYRTC